MTEKTLVMVEIATYELCITMYANSITTLTEVLNTGVTNSLKVEPGKWLCSQHCPIHHG